MPPRSLRQRIERRLGLAVLGVPDRVLDRLAGRPIERDGLRLDRQAQAMIRLAGLLRSKGADVLGPVRYRQELDEIGTLLGPENVPLEDTRDLSFEAADGSKLRARLYVPFGAQRPSPGLVYFHGGGFVGGSVESHDAVCRELADKSRCRVLSCEYRLAPEHPFPAAVLDAEAAFAFAVRRADDLGLDPARLAVGGDSAGGNLSAVLGVSLRDRAPRPIAQLLIYPAVDLTMSFPSIRSLASGFMLEDPTIRWFREQYVPESGDWRAPRASPYFADVRGAPPAIVVTAGFDPLRDEGRAYADKLSDAGVPVTKLELAGLFHGFLHTTGAIVAAERAVTDIAAALRRVLDPR
jgi:acetyl esterase